MTRYCSKAGFKDKYHPYKNTGLKLYTSMKEQKNMVILPVHIVYICMLFILFVLPCIIYSRTIAPVATVIC